MDNYYTTISELLSNNNNLNLQKQLLEIKKTRKKRVIKIYNSLKVLFLNSAL